MTITRAPLTIEEIKFLHDTAPIEKEREGIWCCYFCKSTFFAADCVDEGSDDWHCPKCGLNTVCAHNLTMQQIKQMHNCWFEHSKEWLGAQEERTDDLNLGPMQCNATEQPCYRCVVLQEVDDE